MESQPAIRPKPVTRPQDLPRAQPKRAPEVQTDLAANVVAAIVLDPSAKDEAKVAALASTITAETLPDLQSFSTYLAQRRTLAQRRLLELTSTTAFSRLQAVIGHLQGSVVDFDKLMQPLTDDLQAAFDLRTNDQMNNAMREISEDREVEAEWARRHTKIEDEISEIDRETRRAQSEIAALHNNKTIFGNVRRSALATIDEKNIFLALLKKRASAVQADAEALKAEMTERSQRSGEFKLQKDRLRKMLDLGPGYVQRVEEIVNRALAFIDGSTREVGEIRGEFDELQEQSKNVLTANAQMTRVTAIIDKGIDGSNALHRAKVAELAVVPEGEDALARITRTQQKNELERFVSALSETSISTKKNVSDLEKDAVGANDLSTVVMRQQTALRELHGDGIASITTNLNMTLQAFNTAALTEAGNNAWQAISDMNKVTNRVRDNQVVATAMSTDDANRRIVEKFETLTGISEALAEANRVRADGIANIASSLKELADKTAEMNANLQVNIGLDAAGGGAPVTPPKGNGRTTSDLFLKI